LYAYVIAKGLQSFTHFGVVNFVKNLFRCCKCCGSCVYGYVPFLSWLWVVLGEGDKLHLDILRGLLKSSFEEPRIFLHGITHLRLGKRKLYFSTSRMHSALLFSGLFFCHPLLHSCSLSEVGWPDTDCRLMNQFLVFA